MGRTHVLYAKHVGMHVTLTIRAMLVLKIDFDRLA